MRNRREAQKPRPPADRFLGHATIVTARREARAVGVPPPHEGRTVARALLNGPVRVFLAELIRAGTTELEMVIGHRRVTIVIEDLPDADRRHH